MKVVFLVLVVLCVVVVNFWPRHQGEHRELLPMAEPTVESNVEASVQEIGQNTSPSVVELKAPVESKYQLPGTVSSLSDHEITNEISHIENLIAREYLVDRLNESSGEAHQQLVATWEPIFQILVQLRSEKFNRSLQQLTAELEQLQNKYGRND